jgi:hypothetical protein
VLGVVEQDPGAEGRGEYGAVLVRCFSLSLVVIPGLDLQES